MLVLGTGTALGTGLLDHRVLHAAQMSLAAEILMPWLIITTLWTTQRNGLPSSHEVNFASTESTQRPPIRRPPVISLRIP